MSFQGVVGRMDLPTKMSFQGVVGRMDLPVLPDSSPSHTPPLKSCKGLPQTSLFRFCYLQQVRGQGSQGQRPRLCSIGSECRMCVRPLLSPVGCFGPPLIAPKRTLHATYQAHPPCHLSPHGTILCYIARTFATHHSTGLITARDYIVRTFDHSTGLITARDYIVLYCAHL